MSGAGDVVPAGMTTAAGGMVMSLQQDQLEILERALAPVQAWSNQWRRLRRALADRLGLPDEDATGPPERAPTGHGRGSKRARDRGHSPLSDPIAACETL